MSTLIFRHTTFGPKGDENQLGDLLQQFVSPNAPGPDPYAPDYSDARYEPAPMDSDPYGGAQFAPDEYNNYGSTPRGYGSAAGAPVGAVDLGDDYFGRLAQIESGGDPNAQARTSSALGLYQFTDGTALQYKERLGYGNMSDAQYLALRRDPAVARRMAAALTDDNRRYLERQGLPTDSGALYLAHFAGAGGARRVLSADRNAPISAVMTPAQIRANRALSFRGRSLEQMTAGDLADWARQKMRG